MNDNPLKSQVTEKQIESRLVRKCVKSGIYQIKNTGGNGLPDRLLIYSGLHWFVELKRTGKKPTKIQQSVAKRLRKAGSIVMLADSYEDVDLIIESILGLKAPPKALVKKI